MLSPTHQPLHAARRPISTTTMKPRARSFTTTATVTTSSATAMATSISPLIIRAQTIVATLVEKEAKLNQLPPQNHHQPLTQNHDHQHQHVKEHELSSTRVFPESRRSIPLRRGSLDLGQSPLQRSNSEPNATNANSITSSRPFTPHSFSLLYIEPHKSKVDFMFCNLCHCALKSNPVTLEAHYSGKNHCEKLRMVERIRVTLTLVTGNDSNLSSSSSRFHIGLVPALNLAVFWKYIILALRQEQLTMLKQQGTESSNQLLTHQPTQVLLDLKLAGEIEGMHPHRLRLKYMDEYCTSRPLFHASDFQQALKLLSDLKKIDLVIKNWNDKVGSIHHNDVNSLIRSTASTPTCLPSLSNSPAVLSIASSTSESSSSSASISSLDQNSASPPIIHFRHRSLVIHPLESNDDDDEDASDESELLESDLSNVSLHQSTTTSSPDDQHLSPPPQMRKQADSTVALKIPTLRHPPTTVAAGPKLSSSTSAATTPCKFFSPDSSKNQCRRLNCPYLHAPSTNSIDAHDEQKEVSALTEVGRKNPKTSKVEHASTSGASSSTSISEWKLVPHSNPRHPSHSITKSSIRLPKNTKNSRRHSFWQPHRPSTPFYVTISPSRWKLARKPTPRATPQQQQQQDDMIDHEESEAMEAAEEDDDDQVESGMDEEESEGADNDLTDSDQSPQLASSTSPLDQSITDVYRSYSVNELLALQSESFQSANTEIDTELSTTLLKYFISIDSESEFTYFAYDLVGSYSAGGDSLNGSPLQSLIHHHLSHAFQFGFPSLMDPFHPF